MRCKHASSGLLALEQCIHAQVCFSASALGAQLTQRKLLWSLCNMCSTLQANCLGDVAFRRWSMPHGPRSPTQTSHTHLLRPRGMPSQRTQRRPQHSGSGTLPRRQAPIIIKPIRIMTPSSNLPQDSTTQVGGCATCRTACSNMPAMPPRPRGGLVHIHAVVVAPTLHISVTLVLGQRADLLWSALQPAPSSACRNQCPGTLDS